MLGMTAQHTVQIVGWFVTIGDGQLFQCWLVAIADQAQAGTAALNAAGALANASVKCFVKAGSRVLTDFGVGAGAVRQWS